MTKPLRGRMVVLAAASAVTMAVVLVAPAATPAAHALPGSPGPSLVALQANTGILWTVSEAGVGRSTGLSMMPGTSPRGTGGPGDQIAFQGWDETLWTYRNGVGHSTGFRMRAATSPDILPAEGGGFWIAFQSDTGELKVVDPAGVLHPTGRQMRAGTNPDMSPAGYGPGMYVAFQADTGHLWIVDINGYGASTGLRMAPGTSPAMDANPNGPFHQIGFDVAFQADTGELWSGWFYPSGTFLGGGVRGYYHLMAN